MQTFASVQAALETAEPLAEWMLESITLPVDEQPRFWCDSASCPLAHFLTRTVRGISSMDVNKDEYDDVFIDWYEHDLHATAPGAEKTCVSCTPAAWCTEFVNVLDANHSCRNGNDGHLTVRHVLIILRDAPYVGARTRRRIARRLAERLG